MADVVIAGGGPAGLAAAIALTERGVSALVIDAAGGATQQRGELLPEGAAAILDRLGLAGVLTEALQIEDVVSHWGAAELQSHGSHPGLGLHGWGINRKALSQAMLARARALGVSVRTARITRHRQSPEGWRLTLDGASEPDEIKARYLIDATGRPARIARRNGATSLQGSDLVALVWQAPRNGLTHMQSEATPNGWWYAVPHPQGRTIGLMTSASHAKSASRSAAGILEAAGPSLSLISVAGASGEPRMMDSRSAVLNRMSGPGWLAAGDAAASFDPIASQGLFNALSGGFFAGHAAADALSGDAEAPKVYEALASRTAERTHSLTHLQYAALPYDTPFWRQRSGPQANKVTLAQAEPA